MSVCVCVCAVSQGKTAPIPYGELVLLECHCLCVCNPLCIFEEIRAFWSVIHIYPHIHIINLDTVK